MDKTQSIKISKDGLSAEKTIIRTTSKSSLEILKKTLEERLKEVNDQLMIFKE